MRAARRCATDADLARTVLRLIVVELRRRGLSVRQVEAATTVPKSTVQQWAQATATASGVARVA
ncbi:hypothetical protein GCM10012275_54780 [Longimycelium tulufanense]|uniref:Uncharacterized protein n=2 Tax=Longimycelium tulufanense TaxID=907463 RepID=A0A8J3CJN6_9PSEU|nr:hypothetical protein GCM10012275_54780 [Longimycelium tulufanense]